MYLNNLYTFLLGPNYMNRFMIKLIKFVNSAWIELSPPNDHIHVLLWFLSRDIYYINIYYIYLPVVEIDLPFGIYAF